MLLVYVFEGTTKIHMVVLVPPVKARNSIDSTSTTETTKARAMTTPSTSLKLPFTTLLTAPCPAIEQCQCRYDMKRKKTQTREGVEKSLKMTGVGMPQL
jgi:hypothetical protein